MNILKFDAGIGEADIVQRLDEASDRDEEFRILREAGWLRREALQALRVRDKRLHTRKKPRASAWR